MPFELNSTTSRRNVLKIGGLSVSLAALAAACGEDRGGSEDAGRVGNAPVPTALPDYPTDEAVLLRTASSLEQTGVTIYETLLGMDGVLPDDVVPIAERLVENHQAIADQMDELTEQAGGEVWTCANPWLMERLVTPTFELIQSNIVGVVLEDTSMVQVLAEEATIAPVITTAQGDITLISPTDDLQVGDELEFERLDGAATEDVMAFIEAFESLAAASHQELVSATSMLEARTAHLEAAELEARQSSVLAVALYGEDGYMSPALVGEDVPPTERGQIRHFAVETQFGQTAQIEIKAGPGDLNNVRRSVILQTPAANSLVYNELSCDA
ncbi:hypothetical protein [Ilumatobacter nonamiensis]|uniref:hypothetical protein n=1 Tax=Ilumatobacter nonamiensis TaxID=467093 RepID=UPI0003491090|nr:hypothetical protein [Ilumatobacter nonamiensis]